ncbi:hypothetical protein MTR67_029956 [Solanum verrucosum]|uniref:Carboxypeptidase A inhibitor-like domain-containing protein n=1 Tax=Solanum verrucosum TaxID=315347 RepID=A0AAF0R6U3_SOLVR|nr:hypothetical protein MTR67_029956 [Solanum verrucosum]
MAQDVVLPTVTKLFQQKDPICGKPCKTDPDPICNKPCKTQDDCSGAWFCQACWTFKGTCGPDLGIAMAIGLSSLMCIFCKNEGQKIGKQKRKSGRLVDEVYLCNVSDLK